MFAEPGSELPNQVGWPVHENFDRLGSFWNLIEGLRETLKLYPQARYVLSLEDDIVAAPESRLWVEGSLWPSPGAAVCSLYCASHQTKTKADKPGWSRIDESAWGTLAQVFPRWFAEYLIEHADSWPKDNGEDQYVWAMARQAGAEYWAATPSLVEHIGETSAIHLPEASATGQRAAADFVGEQTPVASARTTWPIVRADSVEPPVIDQDAADDVTFGITMFRRPESLRRLIASIWTLYPTAKIKVADNGDVPLHCRGVDYHKLEFDCGLSASRNWLADNIDTRYYMLLEEDFEFSGWTDLAKLKTAVDSGFQIAGGSLFQDGRLYRYDRDLHLEGDTLYGKNAQSQLQVVNGVTVKPCDMVFNFFMARTEFLRRQRWDDELKLTEHLEYFWRLKKEQPGVVCHVPDVWAYHHRDRPAPGYTQMRQRAAFDDWREKTGSKHGFTHRIIEHFDD